jgi:hypothetical protein
MRLCIVTLSHCLFKLKLREHRAGCRSEYVAVVVVKCILGRERVFYRVYNLQLYL